MAQKPNPDTLTFTSGNNVITVQDAINGMVSLTPGQRTRLIEKTISSPAERRVAALDLAIMSIQNNNSYEKSAKAVLRRAYAFDEFLENGRPDSED